MPDRPVKNPEERQWRILLVYNLYRLLSVVLFLGMFFFSYSSSPLSSLFYSFLVIYFILSLTFLYFWQNKRFSFEKQVLLSGTIDIIAISSMLGIIGNMQSGYGILLNVTIAALSILVPGRLAIFFAALASSLLLCGDVLQILMNNQKDWSALYYSGIYGAGFFATALTAWYLSNWVRQSERFARDRSYELAGMQRINEYIVDRLHSGIIYVDSAKEIRLINSAAQQFLGVESSGSPRSLADISPLLELKYDNFLEKIKQNERIAQTIIEEPYLRVHFFSTDVAHNPEVLIILEDMTFIAQQAQQLKLAALGRFSASIAHELRNPLGAIAHAAQLMGEDGSLSDEDLRLKQLITNNCERMNGVIKNVLQLSRRQKAQPQVIDLVSFLQQFKLDFCHNNQCNLTVQCLGKKQIPVVFDKSQLEQILVILCDNSMQHGRDEKGLVHITIALKLSAYKIILMVSDTGPGIGEEHRDKIFEPFFTTLRSGTGMGLFIAKDLCEINQARLILEPSFIGSCFAITLNASDELLI